jgi:DNA polymerase-3 subunit epsilon
VSELTRAVVLDTETTGFDFATDRVVEVGCVELVHGAPTGRTFHAYVNPRRSVPQAAVDVHGLTDAFLADKPPFTTIAPDLLAFLAGADLVAHNASFDVGMLNVELRWAAATGRTPSSTRWRLPGESTPDRRQAWMPCAPATAYPRRDAPSTAPY